MDRQHIAARNALALALALAAPLSVWGADSDGDGLQDAVDNCILVANPAQCDSDGDNYGNACDGDLNNSGATNAQDVTLFRDELGQPSLSSTGYNAADINCNGTVNAQDATLFQQLVGLPSGPSGFFATGSHTTTFSQTENPISEGGKWRRAANTFTNVRTQNGDAFGTNGITNTYDDSYSLLSGLGYDQTAEAVVSRSASLVRGITHEVELLLRFSDDSQNARGYECLFSYTGAVQIVRWDGVMGDITFLNASGSQSLGRELVSGDVVKASIIGNVIRVYINGTQLATVTDSVHATGQPGVSFFTRPGGNSAHFALASYTVSTN